MKKLVAIFSIITLVSCSKEKQPIAYGEDSCDFCKMTIVDQIHGAEIVTDKGKVYKFDALECLIDFKHEMSKETPEQFFTNHYLAPSELISAKTAVYLISENIPSPMGEFITAFPNREEAQKVQLEKGGAIYTWDEILDQQQN
ncbi:nitrous oxide reductase accessory protein NosL [uncultured Mesonia sp.]|uniref:nitrous oxide reductase accessory protein NosL n=1 Tax=uncultured Mesonia sp. TaxID=399731 RepID=UPI00374FAB2C